MKLKLHDIGQEEFVLGLLPNQIPYIEFPGAVPQYSSNLTICLPDMDFGLQELFSGNSFALSMENLTANPNAPSNMTLKSSAGVSSQVLAVFRINADDYSRINDWAEAVLVLDTPMIVIGEKPNQVNQVDRKYWRITLRADDNLIIESVSHGTAQKYMVIEEE